jgi:Leucine-rich repeat (LRR) protein
MKVILFSLILLILVSFELKAQSCEEPCPYYNDFVKRAQADTVQNTQTKLNYYRAAIVAAKDCSCPELEQSANKEIDKLFIKIEAEKKRAESQAETISEQQGKIKIALTEAEAANKKNVKIINSMDFYDGKFALAFKDGKYGFIDKDGNPKFGFEYNRGEPFDSRTGFAEMEWATSFRHTKYLIDTSGNRFRLIDIPEVLREEGIVKSILSKEDIIFLKKKLKSSTEEKSILSKLEQIESRGELANKKLVDVMNKDKEKLALDFADLAKEDVLSVLLHISKERKIKDRVELLLFDGDDLDTFPNFILEFKYLKKIDISGTKIRSIPEAIDQLKYLKILKFPSTVKEIPPSFYNLENLEKLRLYNTDYQILTEDIGRLKNLTELSLPRKLRKIPSGVYNLEKLEDLTLLYSWISEASEDIGKLKNLKDLSLPQGLKKIPSSVYSLEKLESLFLCGIDEKEIPKEIENLKKLEYLNINMPIEELPASICKLESLINLRLYDTELIRVPESIDDLITLEQLYLPNTIEGIPASLYNLKNLKSLSIPGGAVYVLPEGIGKLTNLERLDLSETWIKVLPDGFDKLTKLEYLELPRSLEELPKGFDKLVNLKNLSFVENHGLKYIPDISNFTKLKFFEYTLYKNEYYDANIEIWKALREKLPNCSFQMKDIEGEYIFLPREGDLDDINLDDINLDDLDLDDLELPSMKEILREVKVERREEKQKVRRTKREERRAARKNKKK